MRRLKKPWQLAEQDGSGARGVEHTLADVASMHGLVPTAAARDQADLAFDGRVFTRNEYWFVVDSETVAVRASMPSRASWTTSCGELISFFITLT
jgi:hypothetical protein